MRTLLIVGLYAYRHTSLLAVPPTAPPPATPGSFLAHASAAQTAARGGREFTINGKQPVEQLEPYQNHNSAVPRNKTAPLVDSVAWSAQLDEVLAAGPSRYIYAPGIKAVEDNLEKDLKAEDANIAVSKETFNLADYGMTPGDGVNLIGVKPGADSSKYVLLGAHYDSIPRQGAAPGAEDNGSGVTTLLSVANALKDMGTPKRSIHFVLFTAEEVGLVGSKAYVKLNSDTVHNCDAGLVLDEVSFTAQASERLIFETSGNTDPNNRVIDTLAGAVKDVVPDMTYEVNYHGFGSDHMTLLSAGVPTVLVIERDNLMYADKYGHTSGDTKANVHPAFGGNP
jgi:Zn-dependent M28 family amino/carboxypeptidase